MRELFLHIATHYIPYRCSTDFSLQHNSPTSRKEHKDNVNWLVGKHSILGPGLPKASRVLIQGLENHSTRHTSLHLRYRKLAVGMGPLLTALSYSVNIFISVELQA